MKLIVISNPDNFSSEHEIMIKLFEAGLEYFHLRKPGQSIEDYKKYIEAVPEKYHKYIVVHRHIDLCEVYNLRGVHFSADNRHRVNEFTRKVIRKSISCHSLEELLNLNDFQYAFLSPVFDSISKEDYPGRFSIKEITDFFGNNILNTKVVALGGISLENIEIALEAGFDGAAVMGAIWGNYIKEKNIDRTTGYFIKLNRKCQQFVRTY